MSAKSKTRMGEKMDAWEYQQSKVRVERFERDYVTAKMILRDLKSPAYVWTCKHARRFLRIKTGTRLELINLIEAEIGQIEQNIDDARNNH